MTAWWTAIHSEFIKRSKGHQCVLCSDTYFVPPILLPIRSSPPPPGRVLGDGASPFFRRMWAPLEVQRIVSQVTHPHSHTHFRDSNALDTPHHCWELSPSCTQWLQGRHMHLVVSGKPVRSEDLRASTQGPEASPAFARDPTCSKAQSCCYNRKRTLPCMHAAIWASLLGLFLMSPTISSISG